MTENAAQRPYIGMHFKCCNVYTRIYLNRLGNAFQGHCPKCAQLVRVGVSGKGKKSRFWSAKRG